MRKGGRSESRLFFPQKVAPYNKYYHILAYGLKTRKGSSAEHILISLGERQLVSPGSILHCLCLSQKH